MTTGLAAFVVRRLAAAILFVVVVSTGALVLARLAPGDAVVDLRPIARRGGAERARLGLTGRWARWSATG